MSTDLRPEAGHPHGRRPGLRVLLQPGWIAIILLALAFTGACWLVLAPWQFSRHSERDALNAQIDYAITAPPGLAADYLPLGAAPAAGNIWRAVSATGTFDVADQVFVRLRQWQGTAAQEVVVPFVLTDGTRILVDRGYITEEALRSGQLPSPLPSGVVTVTGRVTADQPDPLNRPAQTADTGRTEVYGIDSRALLGSAAGARGGFIELVNGTPGVLTEIGLPAEDDGPFLSYALQWCVFGAVALLAIGFFGYREVTDPLDAPGERPEKTPKTGKFDKSQLYD